MQPDELRRLKTEAENPATADIDQLDTAPLVACLQAQDAVVHSAVEAQNVYIAKAVDLAVAALRGGGAVHYFGAGTSGRLGVLDASEIPPTFGAPAAWFQGHIAGGDRALRSAIEGAEDSAEDGEALVDQLEIGPKDLVVALSASGRTPFCVGVLEAGRRRGARTVAIVCTTDSPLEARADVTIKPLVGPESVTGSTRLKAGTAQKMALNLLSTGTMVRLGSTFGNLMVGVTPTNEKLRHRALHLIQRILGPHPGAQAALDSCDGEVRTACVMLRHGLDANAAREHLGACSGRLRSALESPPTE